MDNFIDSLNIYRAAVGLADVKRPDNADIEQTVDACFDLINAQRTAQGNEVLSASTYAEKITHLENHFEATRDDIAYRYGSHYWARINGILRNSEMTMDEFLEARNNIASDSEFVAHISEKAGIERSEARDAASKIGRIQGYLSENGASPEIVENPGLLFGAVESQSIFFAGIAQNLQETPRQELRLPEVQGRPFETSPLVAEYLNTEDKEQGPGIWERLRGAIKAAAAVVTGGSLVAGEIRDKIDSVFSSNNDADAEPAKQSNQESVTTKSLISSENRANPYASVEVTPDMSEDKKEDIETFKSHADLWRNLPASESDDYSYNLNGLIRYHNNFIESVENNPGRSDILAHHAQQCAFKVDHIGGQGISYVMQEIEDIKARSALRAANGLDGPPVVTIGKDDNGEPHMCRIDRDGVSSQRVADHFRHVGNDPGEADIGNEPSPSNPSNVC